MTVRTLIRRALKGIGALAAGENPSAEEQSDALDILNDMIDSWSTERLLIISRVTESFNLVSGQGTYMMGPGGDFNTVRAQRIERANVMVSLSEYPLEILSEDQWESVRIKSTSSNLPSKIFAEGTYPLDTIHVWPSPSDVSTLNLYSWKPLADFSDVNAVLMLPPGYARAIRLNLALELCPDYAKQPDTALIAGALESKENIKRMNIKPQYAVVDSALLQRRPYNILKGS